METAQNRCRATPLSPQTLTGKHNPNPPCPAGVKGRTVCPMLSLPTASQQLDCRTLLSASFTLAGLCFVPFTHACALARKAVFSGTLPHFSAKTHSPGWRLSMLRRHAAHEEACSSTAQAPESPSLHPLCYTWMSFLPHRL